MSKHEGGHEVSPPNASRLKEEALRLYEAGFSVIPTVPRYKRPAIRWEPYQSHRASTAEIGSWWSDRPDREPFGLAVVTGEISKDVVLDFDPAEGASIDDLVAEAEEHYGRTFPETCRVLTCSGGWHDHYILPSSSSEEYMGRTHVIYRSARGKIELRADRSICVMPPSIAFNREGELGQYSYVRPINKRIDISSTWLWDVLTSEKELQEASRNRPPQPSTKEIENIMKQVQPQLSQEAIRMLHGRAKVGGRSDMCWAFGMELLRCGINDPYQLAVLLTQLPAHKEKYGDPSRGKNWDEWGHAWYAANKLISGDYSGGVREEKASVQPAEPANGNSSGREPQKRQFVLRTFAEIEHEFRSPEFLVYPLLPKGEITLLDGDSGIGKSWLCLALAAGLTGSEACPVPYDHTAPKDTQVVVLTSEDDFRKTVGPRLKALGADLSKVAFFELNGNEEALVNGVTAGELEEVLPAIKEFKPGLVIVDHVVIYEAPVWDSAASRMPLNVAVRRILSSLLAFARELNCAVLVARHFRKKSGSARERGAGSHMYVATARSHLVAGHHPTMKDIRVLRQEKMNLARELEKALLYTLDENGWPPFKWLGMDDTPADALTDQAVADRIREEHKKHGEIADVLYELLGDGSELEKQVVLEGVKQALGKSYSERHITRVAREIGVVSRQEGFGKEKRAYWRLPPARREN